MNPDGNPRSFVWRDEPDSLYLRRLILQHSGYTVIAVTHPSRALDVMDHRRVDVELVDYSVALADTKQK